MSAGARLVSGVVSGLGVFLLSGAISASAQEIPRENPIAPARLPGRSYVVSVRAGLFDMVNSPDTYDTLYGEPMVQAGLRFETRSARGWLVAVTADYGKVEGEQVVLLPRPAGTGVVSTLTLIPVHVSVGRTFRRSERWGMVLGVGPTILLWEESGDSGVDGDFGFHALIGGRVTAGRWEAGVEILYSTIPNAVGAGGVSEFYGEDDLGGLSLMLTAGYNF